MGAWRNGWLAGGFGWVGWTWLYRAGMGAPARKGWTEGIFKKVKPSALDADLLWLAAVRYLLFCVDLDSVSQSVHPYTLKLFGKVGKESNGTPTRQVVLPHAVMAERKGNHVSPSIIIFGAFARQRFSPSWRRQNGHAMHLRKQTHARRFCPALGG